jgi:hypothetical protein
MGWGLSEFGPVGVNGRMGRMKGMSTTNAVVGGGKPVAVLW